MGGSLCVGLCCTLLVTKLVVKTLSEKLLLMKATLPSNWQKHATYRIYVYLVLANDTSRIY